MSGLYPSIEDMVVDQTAQAQVQQEQAAVQRAYEIVGAAEAARAQTGSPYVPTPSTTPSTSSLYGNLLDGFDTGSYMGCDVTDGTLATEGAIVPVPPMPMVPANTQRQVVLPGSQALASVTPKQDVGMRRAHIQQGVSEYILCKNADGKMGLATQSIDKGVFVSFVWKDSPAALAGVRFGDQILAINGEAVAGYSNSKVLKILKAADAQRISLYIRDRPWCRTLTVQKNSFNHCGFTFRDGTIDNIVKDTSAARNGMLINHRIAEVNGQNVVGMDDKAILSVIQAAPQSITFTIMPKYIYKEVVRKIGRSTIRKYMDHSVPEL